MQNQQLSTTSNSGSTSTKGTPVPNYWWMGRDPQAQGGRIPDIFWPATRTDEVLPQPGASKSTQLHFYHDPTCYLNRWGAITQAITKGLQKLVQRVLTNQPLEDEFDFIYHYNSYSMSNYGSFCKLMGQVQDGSKRIPQEDQMKDENDQNITFHEEMRPNKDKGTYTGVCI